MSVADDVVARVGDETDDIDDDDALLDDADGEGNFNIVARRTRAEVKQWTLRLTAAQDEFDAGNASMLRKTELGLGLVDHLRHLALYSSLAACLIHGHDVVCKKIRETVTVGFAQLYELLSVSSSGERSAGNKKRTRNPKLRAAEQTMNALAANILNISKRPPPTGLFGEYSDTIRKFIKQQLALDRRAGDVPASASVMRALVSLDSVVRLEIQVHKEQKLEDTKAELADAKFIDDDRDEAGYDYSFF